MKEEQREEIPQYYYGQLLDSFGCQLTHVDQ
jgi:hypothetical protein